MWTSEHDDVILKFLKNCTIRLIVFYIDKLLKTLQVATIVPSSPPEEMTYIIRFENAVITSENMESKLQFGLIKSNHVESLLRVMTNVYAPLFFGNSSWPDSILLINSFYHMKLILYMKLVNLIGLLSI